MVFLYKHSLPALLAALVATATSTSPFVAGQQEITPDTFKDGIESGAYDLVLDVRPQEDYEAGHVPTAIHVPNGAFEEDDFWNNMEDELYSCNSSCSTIVVYCKSGGAAAQGIEKLIAMGFEGTILNGQGVSQWTDAGFALTAEDDSVEPVCATTDICALGATADAGLEEDPDSAGTTSVSAQGTFASLGLFFAWSLVW
eukprot:CAMPEP_0116117640 /NCGR_PEP_ID=MMETSP0329-20121206/1678_1 /TAXON_ID=697910 /ORGANISM="Pseudo-nitzschia arenysensis, Strain B593" /LENGTH=198 /DNA_ID=CAMNT_0003611213 /DNA_START=272 /DNA_END=865 /DNA_ORIENTATION=+